MFVILKDGSKIDIGDANIPDINCSQAVLYDGNMHLAKVWRAVFSKRLHNGRQLSEVNDHFEYVGEAVYHSKPTKEQLLWAMFSAGLSVNDLVSVQLAYEMTED